MTQGFYLDLFLYEWQALIFGWDVGITNTGPELVGGNQEWCKLLWQLPVKKGLQRVLDRYNGES